MAQCYKPFAVEINVNQILVYFHGVYQTSTVPSSY